MKATRCRKRRLFRIANTLVSVITLIFFSAGAVFALPAGQQVVNGQAAFNTQGGNLTITNSPNAIINWQGFSINTNEAVRFIQQSSTSAVLNRVIGQDPSRILGLLQSNGRVFLINPNGILFGQGARIDVNGLVASTLNISNQDFLAGKYNFTAGAVAGSIQNQGTITTPEGGNVYLIAPDIANSGIINSPKGDVILAAGHSVNLVDSIHPDIAVVVSAPENTAVNLGEILAQSGKVGIYGGLIYQKGLVNADSAVVGENGRILLKASKDVTLDAASTTSANGPQGGQIKIQSESGTTLVSGTVTATGNDDKGGDIQVLGKQVGLIDNTLIDASGKSGGGIVLIGGDYQGSNSAIQNAETTSVGKDVAIKADARESGDGGKVVLWADDKTEFYGRISARGGATGGDGGKVEVSGKRTLVYRGLTDLRAPWGKTGSLLLDPTNFVIATVGGNMTGMALGIQLDAANVTIQTDNAGTDAGNITINDGVTWVTSNMLTLKAHADININAPITSAGGGNLILRADSDANGSGNVFFGGSGHVTLNAGGTASIFYNPPAGYGTPTNYAANFTGVTPTAYMLVNTVSDLQNIANNLAGTYALGKDIDAIATIGWNTGQGFDPLGSASTVDAFSGIFDGDYNTISNLYINRPGTAYVGIFSGNSNPTIRNVGIVNVNITGGNQTGGLIAHVGGGGSISNSYVTGTVTSNSDLVGGLTGLNAGTISKCYSTATVNGAGSDYVGGLIGYNWSDNTTLPLPCNASVSDSFSTGAVTGVSSVGGLVGGIWNAGGVNSVTNSYSTGTVTGAGGGLIGSAGATVTSSYWDTDTSGRLASPGGGTGKTTAEMKQQATFAGWNFVNTWGITEGTTYPFLLAVSSPSPTPTPPAPSPAAAGTTGNAVATDNTVVALEAAAGGVTLEAVDEGTSDDQKGDEAKQSDKKDKDGGEQKTYEKTRGDKGKNFCN